MDINDRDQTRDFMSVESFAQLPFIRPSLMAKEKCNGGGIRLFGKDFGGNNNCKNSAQEENYSSEGVEKNGKSSQEGEESAKYGGGNNSNGAGDATSNNRKFECHYCCRNFPTSQALGGHQNAHKRERQQAKRAHLQSVMVHNGLAHHHHHHDAPHVYGMMNYSSRSAPTISMGNYHSWNSMISSSNSASHGSNHSSRVLFHGGHGLYSNAAPRHHQPQPINGSPLAFCRIPGGNSNSNPSALTREHSSSVTMQQQFRSFDSKEEFSKPFSHISSSVHHDSKSKIGYLQKPAGMKDQVSLDLHL